MKAVVFNRFGPAAEVAELVDVDEPGEPKPGEAIVAVIAGPINPADLLFFSGDYGIRPKLPAPAGGEAVGRVLSVAPDVTTVKPGDLVLTLLGGRSSWREQTNTKAAMLFPLPTDADPLQLAMLAVNPPTALRMLLDFVTLKPGDWVIQNAANSGVGHNLMALARGMGVKTVNLVRRAEAVEETRKLGGDVVLVDGDDLAKRVLEATGGVKPKLGIDAIAGSATGRLGACLENGGTVVNYGMLSGKPCEMHPGDVVFRNVSLKGFWLQTWLMSASREEKVKTYLDLAGKIVDGTIKVAIEAVYPLREVQQALAHAAKGGRGGKILLRPND